MKSLAEPTNQRESQTQTTATTTTTTPQIDNDIKPKTENDKRHKLIKNSNKRGNKTID